jgi:hypothetical protein
MARGRLILSVLPYTERSDGRFRDLRSIEVRLPRRRFARLSLNGQYRSGKTQYNHTRYANPGWSFGTEQVLINWTHFRRHCWHVCLEVHRRGITLSYGKMIV